MRLFANVVAGSFVLATALSLMTAVATVAKDDTGAYVTNSIEVNASPKAVMVALQKHRIVTRGRKLLSYKDGKAVISEQFDHLPVIGETNVTYEENEHPNQLDYRMLKSDKLKHFEGSWKLSPVDGGKHTHLQLSAYTDSGINVPFSGTITKNNTRKRSAQRLAEIKQLAETSM